MAEERDTQEIINGLTADIREIVRGEVELAKADLMPSIKHGGMGAGLFGGAGYFALNGLSLLFIAASLALSMLIKDIWPLGFVIVGVALLVVAGLLALVGRGELGKAKPTAPSEAVTQAKTTLETVKSAAAVGSARVNNPELARSTPPQLR